jgi:hypothetical protein
VNAILVTALLAFSAWAQPGAGSADAYPTEPRAVLQFFLDREVGWPGQYEQVRLQIRHNPEAYVPLFNEMLMLPRDPEDLGSGRGLDQRNRIGLLFAHQLVEELGREHAEPLLLNHFREARRLWTEADRRYAEALKRADKAGGFKTAPEEVRNRVVKLGKLKSEVAGLMSRAVSAANTLESPVFVESLLEMFERGVDWNRYHFGYLLPFMAERPDIQPRIDKILADPKNAHMKWHYERALEVYRKSLVQSEPPSEAVTQAPAEPPR